MLDLNHGSARSGLIKRLASVILLLSYLTGCESSPKTEGVWSLASMQSISEQISPPPKSILFDFVDDSVSLVTLDSWKSGVFEKMSKERFYVDMLDSSIHLGSEEGFIKFDFVYISADSLVLTSNTEEINITLKPIGSRNQLRVEHKDLIGKSFKFDIGPEHEESIDFLNDSLLLYGSNYSTEHWSINSYKGHDFLNNSFFGWTLLALSKDENDQIQLSGNYTSPLNYKLTSVLPQYESSMLLGHWIEKERLPVLPKSHPIDTLDQLEINESLFTSKRFERINRHQWQLTNDGKAIYFTDEQSVRWKILELSDSTMILDQANGLFDDRMTITYQRVSSVKENH